MEIRPFLLHALSPLHAGTGQAVEIIDLPIARMRATGMPFLPGSSIKGVLRETRVSAAQRELKAQRERNPPADQETLNRLQQEPLAVFGPDHEHAAEHAGALVVSDARLLALPVRSFAGTFAYVSSPLLLALARRDLAEQPLPHLPPAPQRLLPGKARVAAVNGPQRSMNLHSTREQHKVYLEDLEQEASADDHVLAWAQLLAPLVAAEDPDAFIGRFLLVDDETMTFLWETCTQIDTRVRLNPDTRTVATGALWTEESLPPETLLLGLLGAQDSVNPKLKQTLTARAVLDAALNKTEILQFGGKATVGRGRCRMIPLSGGAR